MNFLIPTIILLPWAGAILLWVIGDRQEQLQHRFAASLSILCALTSVLILIKASPAVYHYSDNHLLTGSLSFTADGLGAVLSCIANVIGSLSVIFSTSYMKSEKGLARYYAMIFFFIGAMSGLVLTTNLFLLFFFWEITALCSYLLISFYHDDPNAVRGGIKALLITQVGGVGLLFASLLIFGQIRSFETNLFLQQALSGEIPQNTLMWIGFTMLLAAAAKSAQFPFFTWLPDAMEAPTPVSALIHAATMVNAGVYLLCRFYPAFATIPGWKTIVVLTGLITILLSSLMAIFANDLKRVLAYSTVSQLGFMFVAVGSGSVLASQFHLFSHAIFKALLFLAAGSIIHSCGTRDMLKMGGFWEKKPFIGIIFLTGSLALAGIPILNGFWSKELILETVLKGGAGAFYALMLVAVALTALYITRCYLLVFSRRRKSDLHIHRPSQAMRLPLEILALGTFISWSAFPLLAKVFAETLPFHEIESESLSHMTGSILSDPLTYLALAMTLIGGLAWVFRNRFQFRRSALYKNVREFSLASFGFEKINDQIIIAFERASDAARSIQTGVINWNILGMVAGFLGIMIFLLFGGSR